MPHESPGSPPSDPPGPDASRRSDRARRAILSATRDLVAEVGYTRLTIEGIAAAAGVGKQTIYRWWRSKAAVLFDAILEVNSHEQGSVDLPDTGDLESDLRLVLRGTVAALAEPANDRLQRAIAAEIQTDISVAEELVRRLLRPQLDACAARITLGIRAGQVDESVDADLAVELLFGPIFHRWLLRTGRLDDQFADNILALVLKGLRPH
ncbi:TetR/AcrR family transcriptional regulator [Zhihengliuella halotolerans]|uniref:TetR family transcriptional regulator n=1 Tax=Zhihengliuella halotolerans TaxID=370736 RepID=A0A4Q8ABH3_9MICC|nr:TetR/AcrR family transcriptional regulator [Zhihengliuella halotolerans]RZU60925.1 TetR family transcriptional regulator [Zhihengliuella halotolerans]